jgi:carbamoyltransferase
MTIILGISCYFHDASAALLIDGQLAAAAEEERFTRIKHDFAFPENSIRFCLSQARLDASQIDYVVFFEKPFVKFDRLMKTALHGFPRTYWMFVQSMRTWLFDKLWIKSMISKTLGVATKQILFAEHHISHAASAYLCSPFEESAILTYDGVGEWATTTIGYGRAEQVQIIKELKFPHSLGLLYSAFTAFLGFEVNEGEYKVMGMAAYGQPRYVEKIWQVARQSDDGHLWLDPRYFSFHYSTSRAITGKFLELFGQVRDPSVPFFTEDTGFPSYFGERSSNYSELLKYNQYYADIAASIQQVTEEMILTLAKEAHRETGSTRLCLAGGVALNSVANARILRETPFEELYIQPSAGDGGGSLGAALYVWNTVLGNSQRFVMDHASWGAEYEDSEIVEAVKSKGYDYVKVNDDDRLIDLTVDRLMDDRVIGWFQGRFEWGPRALGHRSILANPSDPKTKDIVNTKIKYREPFRPFAPSVLAVSANDYFELENAASSYPARFMMLVVPVKDEKKDRIGAVNHLGTARLQTVHKQTNPLYESLITQYGQASGTPILLNTSFNLKGEPIVNSPIDALNTFENSGLDSLVMGRIIVDKPS